MDEDPRTVSKLLFESEVADRLRCSTSKVKRLRLSGQLAFIPGRPPLIAEEDLEAFIDRMKRKRADKLRPAADTPEDPVAARLWVLRKKLTRRARTLK